MAQSLLIPLVLTAAASAADAGIHKNILGSGCRNSSSLVLRPLLRHAQHNNNATTLIISNDEMKDIIKIVKYLENSGLLLEGVSETIQNKAKEQKGRFLSMLLGTLGASLLGNILAGKEAVAPSHRRRMNKAGEGAIAKRQGRRILRDDYGNKKTKTEF